MAQASGIFNIIRQLGGSFGVAVLATVLFFEDQILFPYTYGIGSWILILSSIKQCEFGFYLLCAKCGWS